MNRGFAKYYKHLYVPIIKAKIKKKKLYFLIDTGSDTNFIRTETVNNLDLLRYDKLSMKIQTAGGEEKSYNEKVVFEFNIDKKYQEEFIIHDGVSILDDGSLYCLNIKIDGILGSKFLKKHKWKIDFKNLTINT